MPLASTTTEPPREEQVWLEHLGFLARRYRNNKRVVAFDIRNEIRSTHEATADRMKTGDRT